MKPLKPTEERAIINRINGYIGEGAAHCEDKHSRVEENQKYVRGDQWRKGDIAKQAARDRPAIPFNTVFKVLNSICNREMVERLVPKVFGRSQSDSGIANILDEACRWQRQMSNSEHYESAAFWSAGVGGYGCMHKYWAPTEQDGDGAIKEEDVPIWEMLWPARARETNLSDRQWHVRGKWMGIDQIEALWGDVSAKVRRKIKDVKVKAGKPIAGVESMLPGESKALVGTGWMGWSVVAAGAWVNLATKEMFVAEAEWRETEYYWRAAVPRMMDEWSAFIAGVQPLVLPEMVNPETGEPIPITIEEFMMMPDEEKSELTYMIMADTVVKKFSTQAELRAFSEEYFRLFGIEFEDAVRSGRETIKFAVMIEGSIVHHGERPWGWSYYFLTGFPFESRDGKDFFGVVDLVKGPQDYKNALLSNMLAMYMASPKAPMFVEKGALPNIQEVTDRIASPSPVIEVPDGFLASGKFEFGNAPTYPPMLEPLLNIAGGELEQTLGLSAIDLNTQGDLRRISGTVVNAAKTSSNVIVANLFDSLRKFRKEYGICNIKFLTFIFPTPEEILRVVGEEKMEDMQELPDGWGPIIRYDIMIDEQPSSPTEQMEAIDYLTRTGMLQDMWKMREITTEDVFDLMPIIPESRKRAILKNKTIRDQLAQTQQQLQTAFNALSQVEGGVEAYQMAEQEAQEQQMFGGGQPPQ